MNIHIVFGLQDGSFDWGEEVKGLILSSYFFGYLLSQVPGGRVAEVVSAKWILFASVALNIIPTLLIPPAALLHWSILIIIRVIQGIGGVSILYIMSVAYAEFCEREGVIIEIV